MQLTLLPGKDVAVPLRFGGEASPQHDLVLRFGPTELDGTVAGHLGAQAGQDLLAAQGVAGTCEAATALLDGMLQPGFILIGGIGTILVGYLLYYSLWVVLAKTLFLWLILPGLAVAIACSYDHHQRMQRLRTALFRAAWHTLDPATYYAPR